MAGAMSARKEHARRYLGTFYYVGTLLGPWTCGHRHATVRTAMRCRKLFKKPVIFEVHMGVYPGKALD